MSPGADPGGAGCLAESAKRSERSARARFVLDGLPPSGRGTTAAPGERIEQKRAELLAPAQRRRVSAREQGGESKAPRRGRGGEDEGENWHSRIEDREWRIDRHQDDLQSSILDLQSSVSPPLRPLSPSPPWLRAPLERLLPIDKRPGPWPLPCATDAL